MSNQTTTENPLAIAKRIGTSYRCFGIALAVVAVLQITASTASAQFVIGQTPGTDFLAFEAEDFSEITNGDDATGWVVANATEPIELDSGALVLAPDTDASRGAVLYDQQGGGDQDWVQYQLQFAEAGTYTAYIRYTLYDLNGDGEYGNEDSVYMSNGWGSVPVGPRANDGNFWASTPSGTPGNPPGQQGQPREGNLLWTRVQKQDDEDPEGSDEFVVEPSEVGTVLEFGIAARENGTTIDKLVMSTNPDLTVDELDAFPSFAPNTGDPGDFNDDGVVDLADFVIMAENFNETFSVAESFAKGDQTRDGQVDLADFLATRDIFNAPAGAATAAVPEPGALTLGLGAAALLGAVRRRRQRRRSHDHAE